METVTTATQLERALIEDPRAKAWITPNAPLFVNSQEHADMFLTTYRIRNAYEDLLNRFSFRIFGRCIALFRDKWSGEKKLLLFKNT